MFRKFLTLSALLLLGLPARAQIQRAYNYGVVPTENITTFEVNPSTTVVDDSAGISSTQMTLKTYRVISDSFNWGVELPLSRSESPQKSVNGLGDLLLSFSWLLPEEDELLGFGFKMEMNLPTATDRELGSGKVMVSPSAFILFSLPSDFYAAVGYKHYESVMGNRARSDISHGRFRLNVGYTSPSQWWALVNLYYYINYERGGGTEFVPELEVGTLVNDGTAFYINGSTHAAGSWHTKDWSLGVGFKLLYF